MLWYLLVLFVDLLSFRTSLRWILLQFVAVSLLVYCVLFVAIWCAVLVVVCFDLLE